MIAFLSKQPAARLDQPRCSTFLLPMSLMMHLFAGPRTPHKKWGISWRPGASAPEMLAAAELGYLCKDPHQAHPQDGEADSSQDAGAGKAGPPQMLIRERSFLAHRCGCGRLAPLQLRVHPASPTLQAQCDFGQVREHHVSSKVLVLVAVQ